MNSLDTIPHILVVDDDEDLRTLIADYLLQNGFHVATAHDAKSMDSYFKSGTADLIVLDIMMPGEDGLSICRRVKDNNGPAIIILSAKSEEIDRIIGLELGCDDYLCKPFHPRELLARIKSVLRRRQEQPLESAHSNFTNFFGWKLDNIRRTLNRPDGVMVSLSKAEFELLRMFLQRAGRALTRDQILDYIHGPLIDSFDRAIDVLISRLRRKLSMGADGKDMIMTIRGVGYMFIKE